MTEEEEQEEDENKRIRPRERALGQKKRVWYYEKWVGRHASFAPRRSVKKLTWLSVLSL